MGRRRGKASKSALAMIPVLVLNILHLHFLSSSVSQTTPAIMAIDATPANSTVATAAKPKPIPETLLAPRSKAFE
jgi:hypothetical protein